MLLLPSLLLAAAVGAPPSLAPDAKIDGWLQGRLAAGGDASFIVLFDDPAAFEDGLAPARRAREPRRAVYDHLRGRAIASQAGLRRVLKDAGIPFRSLYIVNGLVVRGKLELALTLAARGEVRRIVGDPVVRGIAADLLAPQTLAPAAGIEWGVQRINADDVWTLDANRGEGIVVASADTGVDWNHPAIRGKYRGWDGLAASHDYNWFDAIDDLAAPLDDHGHGTHTTGTMVGDDGAGNQIGVAPGARWIGCRNMDHGNGTPSSYIACNQYFLAPYPHGGDPEQDGDPSRAPDIVNNSWGCPPSEGCDADALRDSFEALDAAGIFAIVSAGNSGPACSTVADPPAIYELGFVVGASDSLNRLASFSSRGPVTLDGSGRLRPDVAAPGVSVRSSTLGGLYSTSSGTSMAGPHVAGAAALLWAGKPQVRGSIGLSRCLLSRSTATALTLTSPQVCGGTGSATRPNNFWGYGLVDVYAALHFAPDADADGIGDACDCAAADGGAYQTPAEVTGLTAAADKATFAWDPLAPALGNGTIYDVVRGSLAELRVGVPIFEATCAGTPSTLASLVDATTPDADQGFFYLVQARNGCGAGGWGAVTGGAERLHAACP